MRKRHPETQDIVTTGTCMVYLDRIGYILDDYCILSDVLIYIICYFLVT